jgi:hypothetical protein
MSATLYLLKEEPEGSQNIPGLPEWNASHSRVHQILSLLGFPVENICGFETPVDDFLHAIELYESSELGTLVDQGKDATKQVIPGKMTITECAIREGYFADRIGQLKDICTQGKRLGAVTVAFA